MKQSRPKGSLLATLTRGTQRVNGTKDRKQATIPRTGTENSWVGALPGVPARFSVVKES
jgi:hypothetical protein